MQSARLSTAAGGTTVDVDPVTPIERIKADFLHDTDELEAALERLLRGLRLVPEYLNAHYWFQPRPQAHVRRRRIPFWSCASWPAQLA